MINFFKFKFNFYFFNLVIFLILVSILSIYSVDLLKKQELNNINVYAKAQKLLFEDSFERNELRNLLLEITTNNSTPIILLDELDEPIIWENYDNTIFEKRELTKKKIIELKENYKPIEIYISGKKHFIYFENSRLFKILDYTPFVILILNLIFILLLINKINKTEKIKKNSLWIGLAKETAHQLGTPLSSIIGWVELLKIESNTNQKIYIKEIETDLNRLNKVATRFSTIGSTPVLKRENLVLLMKSIENYYQKRIPSTVSFELKYRSEEIFTYLNSDLFFWVVENLVNNSLDALNKNIGNISIKILIVKNIIKIVFTDNGSGIDDKKSLEVFEPGFTTKKRGWGLGLSLSKRIIEEYHFGKIYLLKSKPNIETVFVVELKNSR